jgi:uncharacterized membrane protein
MDYSTIQTADDEYPRSAYKLEKPGRMVSLTAGMALLGLAATRKRWILTRIPLILAGGACIYQAATGINLVNRLMGIRKAENQVGHGFVVERVMTINRPIDDVYSFWHRFENFPTFMQHIADVQEMGDGLSKWIATGPLATRVEWTAKVLEDIPNQLISWKSSPGAQIENEGQVSFYTVPGNRGTAVKVRIVYQPPAGSAGIMISKLFGDQPSMVVLEDLRRFKQIMEAGEIPTTKGQPSGRERKGS